MTDDLGFLPMTRTREPKLFYGWWIVAVSCIGMAISPVAIAFFTMGVFMTVLTGEYGWTRAQVSGAITVGTLAIAVCTPYAGRLIDNSGARKILMGTIGGFAFTFASLYFLSPSIWHLYLIFVLIGIFTAPVASSYVRTVSTWFDKKRGLTLGIAMSGTGVGAAIIPLLCQHLINTIGWRLTYPVLGSISLAVTFLLVGLILRDTPEAMGLESDGAKSSGKESGAGSNTKPGSSVPEALSTSTFWTLILIFLLIAVGLHGVITHFIPYMQDKGFSSMLAARLFSVIGISLIFGRICCGYLVDRFFGPYVAAVFILLSTSGIAFLLFDSHVILLYLSAFLFGLGVGAETDLLAYLTGRYFGLKHLGEIFGYLFAAFMVGTSIGPLALGFAYDTFGSYQFGILTLIGMLLMAVFLCMKLGRFPSWDRE